MTSRMKVVVVGGGFAGLQAVRALRRARVDVTLVDRRNFHLFQPLLYQVATGALTAGEIATPLRGMLKRQRNVSGAEPLPGVAPVAMQPGCRTASWS